ncbi:Predicted ATP-binding protein involved in virulence [Methylomagnum ishizawai]|uniref:Predicted ATP-binding protein involved in virulence n=1 Tax=Methylomagnum ishizawai TaxID=1760988 RepID=A0A1Y6D954_9GAMM|nr:AAA family ATPase [Methylomagnum ishizawai]SMF96295.1 Predicted ATP-binding protein involved in virulence [Methylomagnum ishizawai]
MSETELLRIRQIKVDGLFGLYNHCIDLNLEERVTILHGPNGVGKTVLLRMVNSLFNRPWGGLAGNEEKSVLAEIPFSELYILMEDGRAITITNKSSTDLKTNKAWKFRFFLTSKDRKVIAEDELLFGTIKREPAWLRNFRSMFNANLIDTQRLSRLAFDDFSTKANAVTGGKGQYGAHNVFQNAGPVTLIVSDTSPPPPKGYMLSTVVDCSEDLQLRIRDALASYGQQSQILDHTFPRRVLRFSGDLLDVAELKASMNVIDNKREEFRRINLLDDSETSSFDLSTLNEIEDTERRVMTLYVKDTEAKFKALEDIANRIIGLLNILNAKFVHKQIKIKREIGFVVEAPSGLEFNIEHLSSGEQHEMVLHYDLLFKAQKNTLVLIDEPELSLHLAWQKRFLPDLLEIVKIAKIDVLLATHSPYIVGDRSDLMVSLDAEAVDVSV